jgi:hypothetical protein
VKRQHLLLCTLLICNAAAMEVSTATSNNINVNVRHRFVTISKLEKY